MSGNWDPYYWSPSPGAVLDPQYQERQTPLVSYKVESGEFRLTLTMPRWLEPGHTGKFSCYFEHVRDGPIPFNAAPNNVLPTVLVRDGNGIAVPTSGNNGVTIGAVTADPATLGGFYSQIQLGPAIQSGNYVIEWNATYTPNGPVGGVTQVAETVKARRPFRIMATQSPSQYFLKACRRF